MKPRITLNLTSDGELEIWLNEEGRELFVQQLQALNQTSEHFHMGNYDGAELKLCSRPYRTTDKIVSSAKILFRTDEWDLHYYPHVMASKD